MSPNNEIDAITTLDNILSQLQDPSARDRVLRWAWDKFSTKPIPSPETIAADGRGSRAKRTARTAKQAKPSTKPSISIVKDLNLSPKEKKAFKEFVKEKQPATNQEKCMVAVYYLHHELGMSAVSIDHIYTCYKDANWRVPNLYNVLAKTSHGKGWIDTSNMRAIVITTRGENLVEQDLPKQPKAKA